MLSLQPAFAQESDYQTLQSAGNIPSDFIEKSSERYYKDLETKVSKDEKRFTRKSKESFYLRSNFDTYRFLTSGKVVFNDKVSKYLGEILDELLKDDPALRKKIRVYTVKSPEVNAYTTESGIIFVNLGLLARLTSEAQLAFVLAHEVIHFQEKHVINGYVKSQEIAAARGDYRHLSFDDKIFTKSKFDKGQELKADELGMKIFLKSQYNRQAGHQVFDVLKYADYPMKGRVFTKAYFESEEFKFPDHYYLENVKDVLADEESDDSKSSHPNIATRKDALATILDKQETSSFEEQDYIISEQLFEESRKIARFELSRSYLLSSEIMNAFLHAYAMEENYPESGYLHKNVLKALYNMARFGYESDPDEERGERQRFAYFLKDFDRLEFYTLAIRSLYLYHQQQPEDEEVDFMLLDLMYEAVAYDEDFDKYFSRSGATAQKLFEDKERHYLQKAFIGIEGEEDFFSYLDATCNKARKYYAEKKERKKPWEAPSVEKTLVINPMYLKIDTRKKEKLQYEDAEAVVSQIDYKIGRATDKLNMEAPMLNTLSFDTNEVAKFNMHSVTQEWLIEKLRHDTPTSVSPIHNEIKAISEEYGTQYFTWMGGISVTQSNTLGLFDLYGLVFPAIYLPSAPLWLYKSFKPKKNSFYFSFTFDVRNEGIIEGSMRRIKMRDSESLLQSNIYNTFFELKY